MRTSKNGLELIKRYEGFRSQKYLCAAGRLTIGYGHRLNPGENYDTVTKVQAEELLIQDIKIAEATVNRNVKIILSQNQFDALVSLVFNWGSGNFLRSTLLQNLNAKDYTTFIANFKTIVNVKGKILSGLVRRREEEIKLFLQEN